MSVFPFLKPNPLQPVCTCGHLKYTHRYLDGKLSCTAWVPNEKPVPDVPRMCSCIEYRDTEDVTA